jgi:hypothetical protein
MTTSNQDFNWKPSSTEESNEWRQHLANPSIIENIVKSEHTTVEILREMVTEGGFKTHSRSQGFTNVYASMLHNPNIDEEFRTWLDGLSPKWSYIDSDFYWSKRYEISEVNSFSEELISQSLPQDSAFRQVLSVADSLIETMWHDLCLQEDVTLSYVEDSYFGDQINAHFNFVSDFSLDESLASSLVNGFDVDWISREPDLDFGWAIDVAGQRAEEYFRDGAEYLLEDSEVGAAGLGYAAALGVSEGDLEILDFDAVGKYLLECDCFGETDFDFDVQVTGDVSWTGVRFEDLDPDQQIHLATNINTSLAHPYLKEIAHHLLICMILHDGTDEKARAFLLETGTAGLKEAIEYRLGKTS